MKNQDRNGRRIGGKLLGCAGQAVVELSLTVSLFMFLSLGLMDISRIFFTTLSLQNAVREGARYGILGKFEDGKTRLTSIKDKVRAEAGKAKIDPDTVKVISNNVEDNAGGPGDYIVIQASESLTLSPMLSPLLGDHFSVNVTLEARNEQFLN